MVRLQLRYGSFRMLERSSSRIYSRMLVFCFIATICASKDFRREQYLPKQPGQTGWLPRLEFSRPRTSYADDSFTMEMSWMKPGSFGMSLLPSSSGRTTSGSSPFGFEVRACLPTGGSRPFSWGLTCSNPAFSNNMAFKQHIACERPLPNLLMDLEICSRYWFIHFWNQIQGQASWNFRCLERPPRASVQVTHRLKLTSMLAPEAAGTDSAISMRMARTTFRRVWGRSGPESGGGTVMACPTFGTWRKACFLLRDGGCPVEVRVRGTEGQQPLEAKRCSLQRTQFDANLFDQTYKFRDPQGICMHVSCSFLQFLVFSSHSDRFSGSTPYPIPPEALVGTLVLMLVILTSSPIPKPGQAWRATRVLKGIYRRRPLNVQVKPPLPAVPTVQSTARQSGPQRCSGRVAFMLAIAMLVHTASAAPTPPSGHFALHTPHAVGVTNLCSRKHSFQRAQRRALDTGFAVYRGRCMSAKQLGVQWKAAKTAQPKPPPKAGSPHSIRIVTWNSGGFHLARQAEVRTWLMEESRTSPIHVLCIQETHWPASCEYKDGPWTCIHSGTGTREGGVLIMLNTHFFSGTDIKHAEVYPGRMLHVRICSNPGIDLLCVYQHAWNPAKLEFQHRSVPAEQLLITRRQEVWQKMHGWVAGIPKRNLLGILGDFNSSLYAQHPHVGSGVGHSHLHKKDGHALQSLFQTAGLNAVNTWGKPGQKAATFWTHKGEGSQIDFILVRNPCNLSHIRSTTLPKAPIVHPTGFRHIPVQCFLEWPKPPRAKPSQSTTAFQVTRVCTRFPQVLDQFRSKLQQLSCTAEQLGSQLQQAWEQCRPATAILPLASSQPSSICLKSFWTAKRPSSIIERVTNNCLHAASPQDLRYPASASCNCT